MLQVGPTIRGRIETHHAVRQVFWVLVAGRSPDERPTHLGQLDPRRANFPALLVLLDPRGTKRPDEHLEAEADALRREEARRVSSREDAERRGDRGTDDDPDPRKAVVELNEEAAQPQDPRLVRDAVVLEAASDEDGVDRGELLFGRVLAGRDDVVGLGLERQMRCDVGDDRLEEVVPR